jgi:hypothetical protein
VRGYVRILFGFIGILALTYPISSRRKTTLDTFYRLCPRIIGIRRGMDGILAFHHADESQIIIEIYDMSVKLLDLSVFDHVHIRPFDGNIPGNDNYVRICPIRLGFVRAMWVVGQPMLGYV